MTGELVREMKGHLVFGDAVARVAESLSPLGAAARIIAEASALGLELRRLNLEGRRIEADQLQGMARLENRRVAVTETIYDMHRTVDASESNARMLRQCIENMQRDMLRPGVSVMQQEIYRDLLRDFMANLINNHATGGQMLTGHIHEVLNGAGALAPVRGGDAAAPRQRGRTGPAGQELTGSSNRRRRRR